MNINSVIFFKNADTNIFSSSSGLNSKSLLKIFKKLKVKDLLSCSLVCKKWKNLTNNYELWKKFCYKECIFEEFKKIHPKYLITESINRKLKYKKQYKKLNISFLNGLICGYLVTAYNKKILEAISDVFNISIPLEVSDLVEVISKVSLVVFASSLTLFIQKKLHRREEGYSKITYSILLGDGLLCGMSSSLFREEPGTETLTLLALQVYFIIAKFNLFREIVKYN